MSRQIRFLEDRAILSLRSDRRDFVPYGLFGGLSGTPTRILQIRDGTEVLLGSKGAAEVRHGDSIRFETAGAGGYGNPLERSLAAVHDDVVDEVISAWEAERDYGVILKNGGREVDEVATARCRSLLASKGRGAAQRNGQSRSVMGTSP